MAEEMKTKGGNFRDEILASRQEPRPVSKGRHAREEPLLDTQEEGRAARANPRKVSLLGGAVLSIGIAAFAFGCDDGKSGDELPDAGWDGGSECDTDCPDSGTNDAVLELCGEPGSELSDNEALLSVGGHKAVFTKSKHKVGALEIDEEIGEAVLRFEKPNGETMESGLEVLSEANPTVTVTADGETQTMGFCGIEENAEDGAAVRIATDRPQNEEEQTGGFVHCVEINSGADSVPLEHALDASTVEVLVTHTTSGGEFAEDLDVGDCEPETDELDWQTITFQDAEENPASLTSRNLLLFSEAQTLVYHKMVDGVLQQNTVDLYEVDGAAGTVKIGTSKLGTATLGVADFLNANEELHVALNNFLGEVPEFSYAYIPDMNAEVWVTTTANPNELEVNVLSGEISKTYVVRFSNNKGDGKVDLVVLQKSALSVLGTGSETNLEGKVYTDSVETDAAGVTKIKLTPTD